MRLSQRSVAELIGVCTREVSGWEADQTSPHNRLMPRISEFLGYTPIEDPVDACIGERLRNARRRLGLTRDAAAELLGLSNATISLWENGKVTPTKTNQKRLQMLFSPDSQANRIPATGPRSLAPALR